MQLTEQSQDGMILVIDSDQRDFNLLFEQLKRPAYTVTAAIGAYQALRLLATAPYDLILLNVVVPKISSLELLQNIKRHPDWRQIPVIAISALNEVDAVRCIELGAEDYLHQPFNPALLRAKISAYLERKRLHDRQMLCLQQIERLTMAAMAVEAKTFEPGSLNDLIHHLDPLGQLARAFQHMAQTVHSRERQLQQQLCYLQRGEPQEEETATDTAKADPSEQLQKRTESSDLENLYQPSLYPSLSQASLEQEVTSLQSVSSLSQPAASCHRHTPSFSQ